MARQDADSKITPVCEYARKILPELEQRFGQHGSLLWILVDVHGQALYLFEYDKLDSSYTVSTAVEGCGNLSGSHQTPLGWHRVAEKIGDGAVRHVRFIARQPTSEIHPPLPTGEYSEVDVISSRILWLAGLEPGINAGGEVDTLQRYIYIHGTNEEWRLGTPASHGCIRMANDDVIRLFDKVPVQTVVAIVDDVGR